MIEKQEQLSSEQQKFHETASHEKDIKLRLKEFKKTLEQNKALNQFDRFTLSIVEIVGGYDEDGNKDPAQLTFVYKMGLKNHLNGKKFKPLRKNAKARHTTDKLSPHNHNETNKFSSYNGPVPHRDGGTVGGVPLINILKITE